MTTFIQFLQTVFMEDYHGDKDSFEEAFDGWLSNIECGEMMDYAQRAMEIAYEEGEKASKK